VQTPTLTSDAYATGQAIVTLRESGALKAERSVDFGGRDRLGDGGARPVEIDQSSVS
jgi:hypothetical protein